MPDINTYQELNLHEGASVNDIRAAFRSMAKKYHPDAAGQSAANVEKFIKAQTAYRELMKKAVAHNQARRAETVHTPGAPKAASNWRFKDHREVGLDVYFSLSIIRPESGGCKVILPWKAQEACPRCLGQGRTLMPVGSLYRPYACPRCRERGVLSRESHLEVEIKPEMVGKDKIRLRKAGLYDAKSALRGDLILNVSWVSGPEAWTAVN